MTHELPSDESIASEAGININSIKSLAEVGLVEDVDWALTMENLTVAEAIPLKVQALRVKARQLVNQAHIYSDFGILDENSSWFEHMSGQSLNLQKEAHDLFSEASKLERINNEGLAEEK